MIEKQAKEKGVNIENVNVMKEEKQEVIENEDEKEEEEEFDFDNMSEEEDGCNNQQSWKMEEEKEPVMKEVQQEKAQQELNAKMLKKLFRANLNRTINCVRDRLEDPDISDARLRLYITELHDDMEDYFEMGGNGATHAAYVELYNEIRERKPELISLAWLDFIADDVK